MQRTLPTPRIVLPGVVAGRSRRRRSAPCARSSAARPTIVPGPGWIACARSSRLVCRRIGRGRPQSDRRRPGNGTDTAISARHSVFALVTTVSSTLVRSKAERLMTRRISLVAIRYSSASCSSRRIPASAGARKERHRLDPLAQRPSNAPTPHSPRRIYDSHLVAPISRGADLFVASVAHAHVLVSQGTDETL